MAHKYVMIINRNLEPVASFSTDYDKNKPPVFVFTNKTPVNQSKVGNTADKTKGCDPGKVYLHHPYVQIPATRLTSMLDTEPDTVSNILVTNLTYLVTKQDCVAILSNHPNPMTAMFSRSSDTGHKERGKRINDNDLPIRLNTQALLSAIKTD